MDFPTQLTPVFLALAACGTVESSSPDAAVNQVDAATIDAAANQVDAATIDAAIELADAAQRPFEIAYGNEFRIINTDQAQKSWMLVINTSQLPLNMETLEVRSFTDDHPTGVVTFTANPHDAMVGPGLAGGYTLPVYDTYLFGSDLVTETTSDNQSIASNMLSMALVNTPNGMYDINTSVTIAIGGVEQTLDIVVHVEPISGPTWFEAIAFTRE